MALPQLTPRGNAGAAAGREASAMEIPLGEASLSTWRVKMDPIRPPLLARRVQEVANIAEQRTGRSLDKLRVVDLKDDIPLRSELAGLKLNEFFDHNGSVRFRRLGLTFAAKQHLQEGRDFGSSAEDREGNHKQRTAKSSAKAFFLSTSMVERDTEQCKARSDALYNSVPLAQRLQVQDVLQRQLEVVFSEVPQCQKYFPKGMHEKAMLPLDFNWEAQVRQVNVAKRAVQLFQEKGWLAGGVMGWMFSREEVLILSQIIGLWTRVLRPALPNSCMDRSTFCRLILDLGLVDQVRVPYFWAVSLFDSNVNYIRCCPIEASATSAAPLVAVINNWMLICVLDVIIRRFFGVGHIGNVHRDVRVSFLQGLFVIARYKLPAHVFEESGLEPEKVEKAIKTGKEIAGRPGSADSSSIGSDIGSGRTSVQDMASDAYESEGYTNEMSHHKKVLSIPSGTVIGHELLCSQVLLAMLVEPEVLHVVTQYHTLFQKLHACYAEDGCGLINGHMSYAAFLQLCVDFHLTPALVSSNLLQNAYKSTKCLEACTKEDMQYRWRKSTMKRTLRVKILQILLKALRSGELKCVLEDASSCSTMGFGATASLKNALARSKMNCGALAAFGASKSLPHDHGTPSPPHSLTPASVRHRSVDSTAHRLGSAQSTSNGAHERSRTTSIQAPSSRRVSNMSAQPSSARRGSAVPKSHGQKPAAKKAPITIEVKKDKAKAPEVKKAAGPEPWATVLTAARSSLEPKSAPRKLKPSSSKFGVSALAETLCRIAFTYLTTYGNNPQVSSSAHVRVVWLVAYLRCVLTNLSRSFDKREKYRSERSDTSVKKDVVVNKALSAFASAGAEAKGSWEDHEISDVVHAPLRLALQQIQPELFDDLPHPLEKDMLAPITMRGSLPETAVSDALVIQKRRRSVQCDPPPFAAGSELPAPTPRLTIPTDESLGAREERRTSQEVLTRKGSKRLSSKRLVAPSVTAVEDPQIPAAPPEPLCVVGGTCTLCLDMANPKDWGNPRCPGCSIVDRVPFKDHLFKKLLVHQAEENLKPLTAEPPLKTRRHALTPPPMGKSHELRRQADANSSPVQSKSPTRRKAREFTLRHQTTLLLVPKKPAEKAGDTPSRKLGRGASPNGGARYNTSPSPSSPGKQDLTDSELS